jgi:hypothetical protein
MEYAKKLALVDPRLLNQQQQHVEYKEIQKAADVQAKTSLSLEMRRILDDDTLSDDIKLNCIDRHSIVISELAIPFQNRL